MSEVSTIYDALLTRLAALLPQHTKLLNPYKVDENPSPFLKKGYGVAVGPAENTERLLSKNQSVRREFGLVLTRIYYAKETDVAAKATAEKALLEDLKLVINDVETQITLNSPAMLAKYVGDSGINYVYSEKDSFIWLSVTISVEYLEDLT